MRIESLFSLEVALSINNTIQPNRPEKIFIYCPKKNPVITLELDAIDWMVFAKITHLATFNPDQLKTIFQSLKQVLFQHLGGKCLFIVKNDYLPLMKEIFDMDPKPSYPDQSFAWFGNLIAFRAGGNETFIKKIQPYAKILEEVGKDYEIIIDKQELIKNAKALSELLTEHASWAGSPESRPTYSENAIKHRLNQENVMAYAIRKKHINEFEAFARAYKFEDFYYGGDLVVRTAERNQKLALWFLSQVLSQWLPQNSLILAIAGDEKLVQTYLSYGFEKITNTPVAIDQNHTLVCKLIPKQEILLEYHKEFVTPESQPQQTPLVTLSLLGTGQRKRRGEKEEEEEANKEQKTKTGTI